MSDERRTKKELIAELQDLRKRLGMTNSARSFASDTSRSVANSGDRYRAIFEISSDAILTLDNGRAVEVNPSTLELFSCREEAILGRTPFDFSPKFQPDGSSSGKLAQDRLNSAQAGDPQQFEWRFARPDGTAFDAEVVLNRLGLGGATWLLAIIKDITDRKQTEQALAEEVIRRRTLVEQSRDGIVVLDAQGKVFEANQRYADMLGYTLDEVQDLHVWDWDDAFPRETIQEMLDSVDESGDHFETCHRRKDGTVFNVEISSNGVIVGGQKLIFCICRDVTERNRAERALKESEERLQRFSDAAFEGIAITEQGKILDFNQRFTEIVGYSREQLLNQPVSMLVHPEDQEMVAAYMQTGYSQSYETRILHRDGSVVYVEVRGQEFPYEGRQVRAAAIHDITERMEAEQALKESEQLYRLLAENVTDVIWVADLAGNLKYFSPSVMRQTGYSVQESLSQTVFATLKPDSASRVRAVLAEELAHDSEPSVDPNRYRTLEVEDVCKDGTVKWLEIQASFLRDVEGRPTEILGVSRDITARRDVEAELQRSTLELTEALEQLRLHQQQLVQSEKMASLGQLAAGVAHEINNPIAFVKSNLGTLRDYLEVLIELRDANRELAARAETGDNQGVAALRARILSLEEQKNVAFMIEDIGDLISESIKGVERVRDIVQDLRNFAHAGREEAVEADVNKIIESSLRIAWNELKYKCDVTQSLGDIPVLRCHPERLSQVFVNMLVNAAQSIEEHGEVSISTRVVKNHIEIRISDTGRGIEPENMPRLFDPFFTTKEVGQGTGLGLAISHTTVQKHGGTIEVKSEPGRGTVFSIKLPREGISSG